MAVASQMFQAAAFYGEASSRLLHKSQAAVLDDIRDRAADFDPY